MQFFIALSILVVASSAYLLHQFWSRTLTGDDVPGADVAPVDVNEPPSRLKAA